MTPPSPCSASSSDDSILRNLPQEKRAQLYEQLSEFLAGSVDRETVSPREAATILLGTFLRSAVAGLVIVAPFFLIEDVGQALTVSNLLGILLLFVVGYLPGAREGPCLPARLRRSARP